MAFSYWRTGNFNGFRAPANQGAQGTQNNAGYDGYGYANYVPGGFGREGWNTWAWSGSSLRTDTSVPTAATTWNPADKSSSVVLSGGNLTATGGTDNAFHSVRGSSAQTSGKYYYEVTMVNPTNTGVGVANGSFPLDSTYLGQDANAGGYYNSGFASSPIGGTGTASYATYTNGDIISVALDVDNDLLWFAKNGVWQSGNPSTGTGGFSTSPAGNSYYPVFNDQSSGAAGGGTANFGATAFAYTLPTGFSAWGGASADVTVALTGQSVTVSRGTLSPTVTFALTGQSLSVARGSITAAPGSALTGQAGVAAQGSIALSSSPALSGQALTVARGSVTAGTSDVTVSLTGQSVAATQGSLSLASSFALTGSGAAVSQGSVVATSSDVTVALSGVAAFIAQGSVSAEAISTYLFWNPPPLVGRRISVSRRR